MGSTKTLRPPVRRMFTLAISEFDTQMNEFEPDQTEVEIAFKRLETHFAKLRGLDQTIEQEMITAGASEDDLDKEYEGVSDYGDKFTRAEVKFRKLVSGYTSDNEGSVKSSHSSSIKERRSKYRLPKLELKKFNGDPREWLGFWSQFNSIHKDKEIEPEEKFQYLIQATVEGSPAREVVESFPATKENYEKVIEYLKSRFGSDELLVEVYVRDLLRQVLNNTAGKTKVSITALYDKLETQLRGLETLGVTRDKYAAMLYPLVESALPEDIVRTWERTQSQSTYDKTNDKLTRLMEFLKVEVDGEVRVKLAKEGFGKEQVGKPKGKSSKEEEIPTALELYSGNSSRSCIFCDRSHRSQECNQAQRMTAEDKNKIIKEKRACFICLYPGHAARNCRSKHKCLLCGGRHYAITCKSLTKKSEDLTNKQEEAEVSGPGGDTSLASHSRGNVFLQTMIVNVKGKSGVKSVRTIVDTGAQRSYITEKAARVLELNPKSKLKVTHHLFGGSEIDEDDHHEYEIEVSNLNNSYKVNFTVLDQPRICQKLNGVSEGPWLEELKERGIEVTDVGEEHRDIHLLIGADIAGRLLTGRLHLTKTGPVAVETRLGWTVMGKYQTCGTEADSSLLVTSMHVNEVNIQDLWRLDLIGITEPSESKTREDLIKAANKHFLETVKINDEGRYEVSLPWIQGHPSVPSNREHAERRLIQETKKLQANKMYEAYDQVFQDWLEEGVIEEVKEELVTGSYLPHRPVFKPESTTTPVRPVFNASYHPKDLPSLNQCMEKGENLIDCIPSILSRFRMKKYGIVSDIRKAFLQISIRESDRDFLRFLWWERQTKEMKVFRHKRVVFGLTSSPYLLGATLNHHLEKTSSLFPSTAELLKKSLYIDNCLVSVDGKEEVSTFINEATELMNQGKFELRGWIWNSEDVTTMQPITPLLGLKWNINTDKLTLDLRSALTYEEGPVTKRIILSQSHRIFDPIGFSCPITLLPKKLVQDVWKTKAGWDEEVPEEISKQYLSWQGQLPELEKLEIERHMIKRKLKLSFHVFSDACTYCYATCIFLRCEDSGGVNVQLMRARNRLATIKKITIPRLELLGCLIGARLCREVKYDLNLSGVETHYWTDSSNALYWIKKNENWAEFVWNRVKEIRQLSNPEDWKHIPGDSNPADLPSRGCSSKQLVASAWWEGPTWLKSQESEWPKSEVRCDLKIIESEKRKTVVSSLAVVKNKDEWYMKFKDETGSLDYKRVLAYKNEDSELAEREVILTIQEDTVDNSQQKLKQFHAVKDKMGIWRVKTPVILREDSEDFRYPILLSGDHPLTRMLVEQEHKKMYHCGIGVLLVSLRERFWILGARRLARKVIHACPVCRRFEAKKLSPEVAPLPLDRVRDAAVFEVTGIDLGGPLYLKEKQKSWFVVFTCAIYRAVHLELVTSLSTKALMAAMERFIARRICPTIIYSDNGTNLVGVRNEFREKGIKIEWRLNPPAAPWWGGFWERIVGMVKKLLVRILGVGVVDFEEMTTILTNCEMVINARPLTYLSEEPSDLSPLTPAHFLRDQKGEGSPHIQNWSACEFGVEFKRRCKLISHFKKRFRDEYLSRLKHQNRAVTKTTLKVGDLVMIEVDNKKRIFWPLARVVQLCPGKDNVVRVVKLETENGVLTRPVQRVYPLEASEEIREETQSSSGESSISRFGRKIKIPERLGV